MSRVVRGWLRGLARKGPSPPVVVVVEDDDDSRLATRLFLERRGAVVHEATEGASGLRLILGSAPRLALVDLGLPRMNGFELVRAARSHRSLRRTRLVALSGLGSKRDIERALHAGFDAHLTKPAAPAELERLLGEIA